MARSRLAAEDYVRPVTRGREALPAWRSVWPFRLVVLIAILLLALVVYYVIFHLHLTGQGNSQG